MPLGTRPLSKQDYDLIVSVIDEWWDGPSTALAHPLFFYELGRLARVAEIDDSGIVGFILGFVAESYLGGTPKAPPPGAKIGYVHLVGIHPAFRRRGVARGMYAAFEAACRDEGCVAVKAITTHGNEGSVRFHLALGYTVSNVEDYAGHGRARVVFEKKLGGPRSAGDEPSPASRSS